MILRLHILAIIFLSGASLYGQSFYFRHYQVENGLSNNSTICSLQDNKGFLWFGTKDGLNRFDGYTFKVFRNNPQDTASIGNNFIHSLYQQADDIIWIGTENGLYRYDASIESFSLLKGSRDTPIRDILIDGAHNLWYIAGFTLVKYNLQKHSAFSYNTNTFFPATSLCMSHDGSLLVSTTTGFIQQYNAPSNTFTGHNLFAHSQPAVSKWVERLYATTQGKILAGTSNQGVKLFDPATNMYSDVLTYNTNKTEIFVRNFIQVSPEECWIGTETGIFIYNVFTGHVTNLQKKYNDPFSISDNAVYCFIKDKEGSIWAGTYFGGVNYYPKQHTTFTRYFPKLSENSLSGNVVREIHQDRFGSLWIGTEDAGLNKLDTAQKTFTHYQPQGNKTSISSTNIHGLLVAGDEVWTGTFENGLDILNLQTGKVEKHYSMGSGIHDLHSNFIYCITKTDSNAIVLGTTQGAYLFNRKENNFTLLPGMPQNLWYTCIVKDSGDIMWAATYGNGVNFYNPKNATAGNFRYNITDKNSLASDRVNSIFKDSKENLWFATEDGLCRFNRQAKNFTRYTTKDGFPSSFILSMLEDNKGNLWISTSRGLVCFNPVTAHAIVFTKINGILSDQFNFSAAYKDGHGRMYFGCVKGMVSFNPAEFITDSFVPPVYITGLQVFNKELPIAKEGSPLNKSVIGTDKITLQHNQSTLSIDFAALSFIAPEMAAYAYQMQGLDNDWIQLATNRKVYFTELAPGTYVFKVKAANSSGVWGQQPTAITITILPPWWLSMWAYIFYAAIAVCTTIFFIRNYHAKTEEKNRQKIAVLQSAKEKEILQAKIEFFTNVAHEIKTPLTLIKGPLEKVIRNTTDKPIIKDSLKIMERNTNRLIDLSNQLLDFRQTEIKGFSLTFVQADISELLEDTFISFKPLAEQQNLGFTLSMPKNKIRATLDTEAFNKILTNLFSNAVKYAKSKVAVALLPVDETAGTFSIAITNDGYLVPYDMKEKIFEPFFRLEATAKQKGTGIGLALSRSLAELHKGTLYLREPENNMNVFYLTMPL